MANYMYLMAKLPYLGIFHEYKHINVDEILKEEEFNKEIITPKKKEYEDFLEQIREDIYNLRVDKDYFPKVLPIHISSHNPLMREIEILKLQWNFLEMLVGNEPDKDWLWIYKEKLNIIKRLNKFDKNIGEQVYLEKVKEVRENAIK